MYGKNTFSSINAVMFLRMYIPEQSQTSLYAFSSLRPLDQASERRQLVQSCGSQALKCEQKQLKKVLPRQQHPYPSCIHSTKHCQPSWLQCLAYEEFGCQVGFVCGHIGNHQSLAKEGWVPMLGCRERMNKWEFSKQCCVSSLRHDCLLSRSWEQHYKADLLLCVVRIWFIRSVHRVL